MMGEAGVRKMTIAVLVIKAKKNLGDSVFGNYKREATLSEKHLFEGIKILDSKLGVCAHQVCIPLFMFALLSASADEKESRVGWIIIMRWNI